MTSYCMAASLDSRVKNEKPQEISVTTSSMSLLMRALAKDGIAGAINSYLGDSSPFMKFARHQLILRISYELGWVTLSRCMAIC